MAERIETRLSELYVENFESIMQGWPSYVNSRRRELLEAFNLHGVPDKNDERYRHFDLRELLSGVRSLAREACEATGGDLFSFEGLEKISLVNGNCSGNGFKNHPGGVITGSLRAAAAEMPALVKRYYNSSVDVANDVPAVLCSVFCRDGAFVYIPQGYVSEEPIHIDSTYCASSPGEICFPRVLIIAGEESKANITVTHADRGNYPVVSCFVREVFAEKGARIDITEAVSLREDSVLVAGNYSLQQEKSVATGTTLWLKGGATRVNSVTTLAGTDSETTLYGLYFANGSQLCDINMNVRHLAWDCRSFEVVKGIASGEAIGSFTGMVYVAPEAQKTSALQQSRNLQLSDTSRIFTEPQLEIYADDVKCSHGATVGRLDDDAVYYMRQRGISETDARRLQLAGFVNDIIAHCSQEQVCAQLSALAQERIAKI